MIKKSIITAVCSIILLSIGGCASNETQSNPLVDSEGFFTKQGLETTLVGTWENTMNNKTWTYVFKSDGYYWQTYDDGSSTYECEWRVDENGYLLKQTYNGKTYALSWLPYKNRFKKIDDNTIQSVFDDGSGSEWVKISDEANDSPQGYAKYLEAPPTPLPSEPDIGMTQEDVQKIWGKPDSINTTKTESHVYDQWVYRSKDSYIYFTDGVCDSIQNSK